MLLHTELKGLLLHIKLKGLLLLLHPELKGLLLHTKLTGLLLHTKLLLLLLLLRLLQLLRLLLDLRLRLGLLRRRRQRSPSALIIASPQPFVSRCRWSGSKRRRDWRADLSTAFGHASPRLSERHQRAMRVEGVN